MTTFKTLIVAAFAAATLTVLTVPAHATDGWKPDAVMVMPLDSEDVTSADRELLDMLDAEPGDIVSIVYEQLVAPLEADTYEAAVFEGTDIEVPSRSPLFTPAGRSSTGGDSYPKYGTLLAWDDSEHSEIPVGERPDSRVFIDEPGTGTPAGGWTPEALVWVSNDQVTERTSLTGTEATWVRVGFGLQDVWVDARKLIDPAESDTVSEMRATNLADAAENPEVVAEPIPSAGMSDAPAPDQESSSGTVSDHVTGSGRELMIAMIGLGALLAAAVALMRLRRMSKLTGDAPVAR